MMTHNIYIFFKDTLTVPKIKDYMNEPNIVYEEIQDILRKKREDINLNNNNSNNNNNNNNNENDMKNELKNFFKEINVENNNVNNFDNINMNYSANIY
jgi:hypothetical protein